jgi:hypothetical protein
MLRYIRKVCVAGRLMTLASAIGVSACSSSDEASCSPDDAYAPNIAASDFVAQVDNPLWPLVAGTRYVFEGGGEHIEVSVTGETKQILGVAATVVRDTATVAGEVTEDTFDWYAQDAQGNVWYFGEDTKEYEGGQVVSSEGSWESGVHDAKPGIVMHATQPAPGAPYRQEYYACAAEDQAEVASQGEAVSVPYGSFTGCLKTREFTPLEPDVNEYKYYCPGVGLVLEVDVATGQRTELLSITGP